jgi:hypothetical protein
MINQVMNLEMMSLSMMTKMKTRTAKAYFAELPDGDL